MAYFTVCDTCGVSITDQRSEDDTVNCSGNIVVRWEEYGNRFNDWYSYGNLVERKAAMADAFAFAAVQIKNSDF